MTFAPNSGVYGIGLSPTFTLLALQKNRKQFHETVTTHLWPGLIFLLVLTLGSHRVLKKQHLQIPNRPG